MNFSRYLFSGGASVALCLAFVACGDDVSSPNSLNYEQPGEPIAKVDTSLLRKDVYEGGGSECAVPLPEDSLTANELDAQSARALAKKYAYGFDEDEYVVRPSCGGGAYRDIHLYINSRIRVLDPEGNPMAGAKVYEGRCTYDDESCQYVTDADGYVYIDSVNFLSYWEKYEGALEELGEKKAFSHTYEELQLRAISADSSYGANIYASYSRASFVEINGEQIAELRPIALEPVYTTKLYLDSIHVLSSEGADEFIEENGFGICVDVKRAYDIYVYAEELLPSYFYPCQMVTEEDKANGYVMVYGLPENVYWISIGNPNGQMSMGRDSLVVKRPN